MISFKAGGQRRSSSPKFPSLKVLADVASMLFVFSPEVPADLNFPAGPGAASQ